jgi:hypothetical protein
MAQRHCVSMTDSLYSTAPSAETSAPAERLGTAEARVLLRECFTIYRARLIDAARSSLDMSSDLFEWSSHVSEAEVDAFRTRRGEWLDRFAKTIDEFFERRIAGQRRRGRRPDAAAEVVGVKMLTDFDQAKQTALVQATQNLHEYTRREVAALDARFVALMPERTRSEVDNPFAPAYVLDAIGVTSRAVYPDARIWRPLMERVLGDMTPALNKMYIAVNRFLANQGVLPEVNAELRARSDLRPAEDTELLPAFKRLLANVSQAAREPQAGAAPQDRNRLPAATVVAALAALARRGGRPERRASVGAAAGDDAFPDLDPLLALGGAAATIEQLTALQRLDLPAEVLHEAQRSFGAQPSNTVPGDLIPYIRDMLAATGDNASERAAADVVSLLFEYIARDASIPAAVRPQFARLQIPILKTALLDPTFFHDSRNPARHLLDHLAAASIGAPNDPAYCAALQSASARLVEWIAERFEIDVGVFAPAARQIGQLADEERRRTSAKIAPDIAAATAAEQDEADRGHVRALVRDRLAGEGVPVAVRGFAETTWTDYLTLLRKQHGEHSVVANEAVQTLDDLLWSVMAKERTGQKARLAKMIPRLVGGLRKGAAAAAVSPERMKTFLDALYQLHIAAIKPKPEDATAVAHDASTPDAAGADAPQPPSVFSGSVHDFVSEMVPGTWLTFRTDAGPVDARLAWTGALRMRYIFASRSGLHIFVYTPEELAHAIGSGSVSLLLEPVSLFDRAVSFALNTLAARTAPRDGPFASARSAQS